MIFSGLAGTTSSSSSASVSESNASSILISESIAYRSQNHFIHLDFPKPAASQGVQSLQDDRSPC